MQKAFYFELPFFNFLVFVGDFDRSGPFWSCFSLYSDVRGVLYLLIQLHVTYIVSILSLNLGKDKSDQVLSKTESCLLILILRNPTNMST